MDKALYLGTAGQRNSMKEMEILSNNLANLNTPGFRADYETIKQNSINNNQFETRVYPSLGRSYSDFKQGPILKTGRDLDVAISGDGMFVVQSKTGQEGYTRAGNFEVSNDGFLTSSNGNIVLGINGAINVANAERVNISDTGTVSIKIRDQLDLVTVGQLKMVKPDTSKLEKGTDGLFYTQDGAKIEPDKNIRVESGSLEGSNVNPVDTLIKLIDLSRQYEIHSKFIKNITDNAIESNRLLDMKG